MKADCPPEVSGAAQGEAEAKKLSADAEAYFNKTVAASITPEFVQYKALEKWNGELPQMMGTGAVPFVNVGSLKPAQQPQK